MKTCKLIAQAYTSLEYNQEIYLNIYILQCMRATLHKQWLCKQFLIYTRYEYEWINGSNAKRCLKKKKKKNKSISTWIELARWIASVFVS